MKRNQHSMTSGPLFSGIITYTVPIILTSLLQLLFNAADLVIVGRYCGSISVAAVSVTGSITHLIINLFIGLSVGAGVSVAHGLGGNRPEEVHRTVHTALPIALISGAILTVIGVVFAEDFLIMMKTPEDVLPLSTVYMRIYFGGIVFSMVYNFCAAILRAAGDTKSPLVFLIISGIANVVLNVIFVTVFQMNVAGVALATTVSFGISAVLTVRALMKRTDICKLYLRKLRFYKEPLLKILRIGVPAGIQGCLFSISNVIIQSSINSFNSEMLMSGNGAAANIEGFIYATMNAFHQSAVNYTGQNLGAHRYDRIRKSLGVCLIYTSVIGLALSTLTFTFGRQLLGIYIVDSQEAIEYGLVRFSFICLPYFLCGIMDVFTGALRGLGASLTPMLISVLGVCGIRLGWIFTIFQIPQYHTPKCLYLSYPISWTITLLAQGIAFSVIYRKKSGHSILKQNIK
ncbi:MAG: MATE family efflux transporter [Oscillospiraceae bacterium]|nr:MATE family efflux transporter [Oscillospiraceae bacterium]